MSPLRLKAITVEELAEIIKPLAVASPPEALLIVASSTLNWKPAMISSLEYVTSQVPSLLFDKPNVFAKRPLTKNIIENNIFLNMMQTSD